MNLNQVTFPDQTTYVRKSQNNAYKFAVAHQTHKQEWVCYSMHHTLEAARKSNQTNMRGLGRVLSVVQLEKAPKKVSKKAAPAPAEGADQCSICLEDNCVEHLPERAFPNGEGEDVAPTYRMGSKLFPVTAEELRATPKDQDFFKHGWCFYRATLGFWICRAGNRQGVWLAKGSAEAIAAQMNKGLA